jgi:hypothetical protein
MVDYMPHTGHLTPIGLFDLLDENRDKIIVLDDVSAIFNERTALQLLLAALDKPRDGSRVRYVGYKTATGYRTPIPFTGGLICISNLRLDGRHREVLAALKDRVFVMNYDPTDEQIIALIRKIAEAGVDGVSPGDAQAVARFLIEECKSREIRLTIRLFCDKAIKDFRLHAAGKCEADWRDLIRSNLEEQLIELEHATTDLSRAEQIDAERRVALDVCLAFSLKHERIEQWKARTGKSQPAFYRRVAELKKAGRLVAGDSAVSC